MMSERFDPSKIVERDGDVISGADEASLEGVLPGEAQVHDEAYDEAVRAARTATLPDFPIVRESEAQATPVERAYEVAEAKVETRLDQGLDHTAAWAEVDPDGSIRKAFHHEQTARQAAINSDAINKIRETRIGEQRAKVAAAYPSGSHEQTRALNELNARLLVEAQRRTERS